MKERPILFSGPMVEAILEGRKTQTRRVIKGQVPPYKVHEDWYWLNKGHNFKMTGFVSKRQDGSGVNPFSLAKMLEQCPFGQPGDHLWVRETWAEGWTYGGSNRVVFYRATNDGYIGSEAYPVLDVQNGKFGLTACGADASAPEKLQWRPSIHMPRWASRIDLLIKDIRVERLQNISEEDARAEGSYLDRCACMPRRNDRTPIHAAFKLEWCHIHGEEFVSLWKGINQKPGTTWDENPWVWVVEFERVEP